MNEIRAFLAWQWQEIRTSHWTAWAYFLGMIMLIAGFVTGSDTAPRYFGIGLDTLLTVVGGVAVLTYLGGLMIEFQLDRYRRDRDLVLDELKRKQQ